MESFTIENPRTANPKKTQKLLLKNQIKLTFIQDQKPLMVRYNQMLLKEIIFQKNCSQCYETKILDSIKYDEQLDLTRSSIKIELFEITKEF